MSENHIRLRIKTPAGAEFEAEGPEDFIISEKEDFLQKFTKEEPNSEQQKQGNSPQNLPPNLVQKENSQWINITENNWKAITQITQDDILFLKIKPFNLKADEAALIILASEKQLRNNTEISAINLSKSIKLSGFNPNRIDRLLLKYIKSELITAAGTKRNRSYIITKKGLEKAGIQVYNITKTTGQNQAE